MTIEFKLPDLGEGIHEAEVLAVKVADGDSVKEDEAIFEVETDKAVVEIPSPVTGTIQKICVREGQIISVGTVMVIFEMDASKISPQPDKEEEAVKTAVASHQKQQALANGDSGLNGQEVALKGERSQARPIPAAPATRSLARELNIDLYLVKPTGPGGRVLKEDVRAFAHSKLTSSMAKEFQPTSMKTDEAASLKSLTMKYGGDEEGVHEGAIAHKSLSTKAMPSTLPDFSKYGPVNKVPLRSIRRKIALNMTQSWTHIPHVTHFDEANITTLQQFLTKHKSHVKERSVHLTITVFVLKAAMMALKQYPQFNASLDEQASELVFKQYYNIGLAVATERGLIVPVMRDVDKKSLLELSKELVELTAKTKASKIEPEQLQGGTFTITNIGAIGGTSMSPMVRYPEAAILGMARAAEKPIVKDGRIEIATILPLALSFDHRIADGAEAAYFVQHVVRILEEPLALLLEA